VVLEVNCYLGHVKKCNVMSVISVTIAVVNTYCHCCLREYGERKYYAAIDLAKYWELNLN